MGFTTAKNGSVAFEFKAEMLGGGLSLVPEERETQIIPSKYSMNGHVSQLDEQVP